MCEVTNAAARQSSQFSAMTPSGKASSQRATVASCPWPRKREW
jgi:hypothetical protein